MACSPVKMLYVNNVVFMKHAIKTHAIKMACSPVKILYANRNVEECAHCCFITWLMAWLIWCSFLCQNWSKQLIENCWPQIGVKKHWRSWNATFFERQSDVVRILSSGLFCNFYRQFGAFPAGTSVAETLVHRMSLRLVQVGTVYIYHTISHTQIYFIRIHACIYIYILYIYILYIYIGTITISGGGVDHQTLGHIYI